MSRNSVRLKCIRFSSFVVLGGLLLSGTAPSAAENTQAYADDVMAVVDSSLPANTPGSGDSPVQLNVEPSQYVGTAAGVEYAVSEAPAETVALTSPGSLPMEVRLPDVDASSGVLTTDAQAVVYPEGQKDVAVAVQTFTEGAQIATVLDSESAPETFEYALTIPSGGSAVLNEEEGIAVMDASGDPVGFITAPWARDGAGRAVPTRYTLEGNVVTQVIEHKGSAFTYPVVADPYIFKDLIKSATWDWIPRSPGGGIGAGWTLRVKPTKWARFNAGGYYVGYLGWKELLKKYKNRGLCCNLDSMKDQWICHHQFVALYRPGNPTWNLDEWRADMSYAKTVRYQCNPPRGGRYVYG